MLVVTSTMDTSTNLMSFLNESYLTVPRMDSTVIEVKVVAVIIGLVCILVFSIGMRTVITLIRKRRHSNRTPEICDKASEKEPKRRRPKLVKMDAISESEVSLSQSTYVNIPTPKQCRAVNVIKPYTSEQQQQENHGSENEKRKNTGDDLKTGPKDRPKQTKRPAEMSTPKSADAMPHYSNVDEVDRKNTRRKPNNKASCGRETYEHLTVAENDRCYLSLRETQYESSEDLTQNQDLYEDYDPRIAIYENA